MPRSLRSAQSTGHDGHQSGTRPTLVAEPSATSITSARNDLGGRRCLLWSSVRPRGRAPVGGKKGNGMPRGSGN